MSYYSENSLSNNVTDVSNSFFSAEEHSILSKHSFSSKTCDIDPSSKTVYIENTKAFRRWTIIYPIYFDVKRSIKEGRKVPVNMAVANPLAKTIANGAKSLGFLCIFEVFY